VPVGASLDGYRVVLAPNLYSVSVEAAAWLSSYVAGGGQLACGFFSGVVDELDHIHQAVDGSGGGYPGPLREVLGVVVDEYWPVADDDAVQVLVGGHKYAATMWSEWLDATTADVVGVYGSGTLRGRAAVTRNAFGSGAAWYVSCHLGPGIGAVLDRVLEAASVGPVLEGPLPPGVEVTRRSGPDASYLFVLNHNNGEVELSTVPPDAVDLLSGAAPGDSLRLPALGAAVLKVSR
jgi:beta-galactosidase